jgi:hypothetical protein
MTSPATAAVGAIPVFLGSPINRIIPFSKSRAWTQASLRLDFCQHRRSLPTRISCLGACTVRTRFNLLAGYGRAEERLLAPHGRISAQNVVELGLFEAPGRGFVGEKVEVLRKLERMGEGQGGLRKDIDAIGDRYFSRIIFKNGNETRCEEISRALQRPV